MLSLAFRDRWDFHSVFSFLLHTQAPSMGDGRIGFATDQVQVPRRGARDLALATVLLLTFTVSSSSSSRSEHRLGPQHIGPQKWPIHFLWHPLPQALSLGPDILVAPVYLSLKEI